MSKNSLSPKSSKKKSTINPKETVIAKIPDAELFKRELDESILPMHCCSKEHISLFLFKGRVWENWMSVPHVQQFCNSNSKKSKSSKSPKNKAIVESAKNSTVQDSIPEVLQEYKFEPAILNGLIVADKALTSKGYNAYINVTAWLYYSENPASNPCREDLNSTYQAFDKTIRVYPSEMLSPVSYWTERELRVIKNIIHFMGEDVDIEKFRVDLTGLPDSFVFQRPNTSGNFDGFYWEVKTYLARSPSEPPFNNEEPTLDFLKSTFIDVSKLNNPNSWTVERFLGPGDDGTGIKLLVNLDKEVYSQQDEIKVHIRIENDSSRIVVYNVSVSVEQCISFYSQMPQDYTCVIGRKLLGPDQNGLPVNPKNKSFTSTVALTFAANPNTYNLVLTGNNKLINSSFILFTGEVEEGLEEKPAVTKTENRSTSPKKSKTENSELDQKSSSSKQNPKSKKENSEAELKSSYQNKNKHKTTEKEECKNVQKYRKKVQLLTNRQACRPVFISYDVVVRLDLKNIQKDCISGVPSTRVPFFLATNKRLNV